MASFLLINQRQFKQNVAKNICIGTEVVCFKLDFWWLERAVSQSVSQGRKWIVCILSLQKLSLLPGTVPSQQNMFSH